MVALTVSPAIVPEAVISVASEIAPVLVIPSLLLLIPPSMLAPPVLTVKPLDAVRRPAEVIAPVPVVEIFPLVETTPFSVIVNLLTLPYWMASAVPVPAFVSLMITPVAVPALVSEREVEVERPDERVIATFLPSVVAIVLPRS